jgi:prepilin-type N-terminal cleavage/methylation domain-containing protein
MASVADIEDFQPVAGVSRSWSLQDGHPACGSLVPRRCSQLSSLNHQHSTVHRAFTLIEIMIVVAIMGIVLTMGVPIVYKAWHKAPMSKAVSELMEVCSHARQQAIMRGVEVDVIFHPKEGRFEVGSIPGATNQSTTSQAVPSFASGTIVSSGASGFSGRLSDKVGIELMDINKLPHEFREDDYARVRFFPNGTCDELTLILLAEGGERREITLEVTTGLVNVESDPRKFK